MEKSGIKTAVKTATNFVNEIYEGQEIFDLLLEEIKETNNNQDWAITLSFKRKIPEGFSAPFSALVNNRIETKFKRIIVDKESMEVKKMEHREFDNE